MVSLGMDNEYHKKWRENNRDKVKLADEKFRKSEKRKEYLKNYQKSDKSKEYQNKYKEEHREEAKAYDKMYRKKYPEKANARRRKYYYTAKGIATMLRKHDARRLGVKKSLLTWQIIEIITERDKVCVYCGCELNGNVEYDHINPFKPFSEKNIVRSCNSCNKDKSRADMVQWMNFKGYKISEKLKELYKKAYED